MREGLCLAKYPETDTEVELLSLQSTLNPPSTCAEGTRNKGSSEKDASVAYEQSLVPARANTSKLVWQLASLRISVFLGPADSKGVSISLRNGPVAKNIPLEEFVTWLCAVARSGTCATNSGHSSWARNSSLFQY